MQIKKFDSLYGAHVFVYERILHLISPLESIYPNLTEWYRNTFLPGLLNKERIYILAVAENDDLVGCALLKKTPKEKKISTLFVREDHRKKGLGKKLMETALKELGNNAVISVSEEDLSGMKKLLKSCHFHLNKTQENTYRQGKKEYFFTYQEKPVVQKKRVKNLKQNTKTPE